MACSNFSITLSGTSYGPSANNTLADDPLTLSVSIWVKYTVSAGNGWIIDKGNGSGGGTGWSIVRTGASLQFNINGVSNNFAVNSGGSFSDGVWHNVVATWNTVLGVTTLKIYVDGTLQNTAATGGVIGSTSTAFAMAIGDSTTCFIGEVDDARVWTRVLSAGEVSSIFAAGDPSNTNLVSYWKIEEGSGNILADSSGNSNTITFGVAPTWTTDTPPELPPCGILTLSLFDSLSLSDSEVSALAVSFSESANITDAVPNAFSVESSALVSVPTPVVETLVNQLVPASAKTYFRIQE